MPVVRSALAINSRHFLRRVALRPQAKSVKADFQNKAGKRIEGFLENGEK